MTEGIYEKEECEKQKKELRDHFDEKMYIPLQPQDNLKTSFAFFERLEKGRITVTAFAIRYFDGCQFGVKRPAART